jgi:glycosyltransferase involved in cell wall biosynthesis
MQFSLTISASDNAALQDKTPLKKSVVFIGNSMKAMFRFRWHTIQMLSRQGYQVSVVAPMDARCPNVPNIQFIELGDPSRLPTISSLIKQILTLRRHLEGISASGLTYAFAYSPKAILLLLLSSIRLKVVCFPFFIGLGALFVVPRFKFKKWLFLLILRISRKVGTITCLNRDDMLLLRKSIPCAKFSILNGEGIAVQKFIPPVEPVSRLRFVMISRPLRDKGVELYLDAVKYFLEHSNGLADFAIYGFNESSVGEDLRPSFVDECFSANICLMGEVADIAACIRPKDVLVLPSLREGMSTVCMEMRLMQLPVIGSNVPGIKEIIRDGVSGVLIAELEPKQFGKAMTLFASMTDREFSDFREQIRNSSRNFNDQDEANLFYIELLSGNHQLNIH